VHLHLSDVKYRNRNMTSSCVRHESIIFGHESFECVTCLIAYLRGDSCIFAASLFHMRDMTRTHYLEIESFRTYILPIVYAPTHTHTTTHSPTNTHTRTHIHAYGNRVINKSKLNETFNNRTKDVAYSTHPPIPTQPPTYPRTHTHAHTHTHTHTQPSTTEPKVLTVVNRTFPVGVVCVCVCVRVCVCVCVRVCVCLV